MSRKKVTVSKDEEDDSRRMIIELIEKAAKEHPASNVAKLIFSLQQNPNQSDIISLFTEISKSAFYAADFRICMKYYVEIFESLSTPHNELTPSGMLIIAAAQIYSKRVDNIYDRFEALSIGLTSSNLAMEEERARAEAEAAANGASTSSEAQNTTTKRKPRRKKGASLVHRYDMSFKVKAFKSIKGKPIKKPAKPERKKKAKKRDKDKDRQVYTSQLIVHGRIVDLDNPEDYDSKMDFHLFSSYIESRTHRLLPDYPFRLHYMLKDYEACGDAERSLLTFIDPKNKDLYDFEKEIFLQEVQMMNGNGSHSLPPLATEKETPKQTLNQNSDDMLELTDDSGLGDSLSEPNTSETSAANDSTSLEATTLDDSSAASKPGVSCESEDEGVGADLSASSNDESSMADDLPTVEDGQVKVTLPHHENEEPVPFSQLDIQDKMLLSPTISAVDCLAAVPNKENLVIHLDDDLKVLFGINEENNSSTDVLELPKELKVVEEPTIRLNILQIHEKHFKKKSLFKLGEEFALLKKNRCLKRKAGEDLNSDSTPKLSKYVDMQKMMDDELRCTPTQEGEPDFEGFEELVPFDSFQEDFAGFPETPDFSSEESFFASLYERHEVEKIRAYEKTYFPEDFPPYLHIRSDLIPSKKLTKSVDKLVYDTIVDMGTNTDHHEYLEIKEGAKHSKKVTILPPINGKELPAEAVASGEGTEDKQDEQKKTTADDDDENADLMREIMEALGQTSDPNDSDAPPVDEFLKEIVSTSIKEVANKQKEGAEDASAESTPEEESTKTEDTAAAAEPKKVLDKYDLPFDFNVESYDGSDLNLDDDHNKGRELSEYEQMKKRVNTWHAKLRPILANAKERHHFDIFDLGTEIIENCQANEYQISFAKLMEGKDKSFCSRYFLSALMLANTENIELSIDNEDKQRETDWSEFNLTLLSTKRHAVASEDNIGFLTGFTQPSTFSNNGAVSEVNKQKAKPKKNLSVRFSSEVTCQVFIRDGQDGDEEEVPDSEEPLSSLQGKLKLLDKSMETICELKEEYDTPRKERLKRIKIPKHSKSSTAKNAEKVDGLVLDAPEEVVNVSTKPKEPVQQLLDKPVITSVIKLPMQRDSMGFLMPLPVTPKPVVAATPPSSPMPPLAASTPTNPTVHVAEVPCTSKQAREREAAYKASLDLLKHLRKTIKPIRKVHLPQWYRKVKKIPLIACK